MSKSNPISASSNGSVSNTATSAAVVASGDIQTTVITLCLSDPAVTSAVLEIVTQIKNYGDGEDSHTPTPS